MSTEPISSDSVTVGDIKRALAALDKRRPQLPELYCSVSIYSDGSGFVHNGQGLEMANFRNGDNILKVINGIESGKRK